MRSAFENTIIKRLKLIEAIGLPLAKMIALLLGLLLTLTLDSTTAAALQTQTGATQAQGSQAKATPQPKATQAQAGQDKTATQWRVISPSDALATIEMPKKPKYIERKFSPVANKPPIKVYLHMATVNEGKATYVFSYHDLHEEPNTATAREMAFEGAVRGSVYNVQGTLLTDVTKVKTPARGRQFAYRFNLNEKSYIGAARVFLVGKRMYLSLIHI